MTDIFTHLRTFKYKDAPSPSFIRFTLDFTFKINIINYIN